MLLCPTDKDCLLAVNVAFTFHNLTSAFSLKWLFFFFSSRPLCPVITVALILSGFCSFAALALAKKKKKKHSHFCAKRRMFRSYWLSFAATHKKRKQEQEAKREEKLSVALFKACTLLTERLQQTHTLHAVHADMKGMRVRWTFRTRLIEEGAFLHDESMTKITLKLLRLHCTHSCRTVVVSVMFSTLQEDNLRCHAQTLCAMCPLTGTMCVTIFT